MVHAAGNEHGEEHPHAHRLAMQVLIVTGMGFDQMGQCVPEIENRAQPGLFLVLLHHASFDPARAEDRLLPEVPVPPAKLLLVGFQEIEQFHITDDAVLDQFEKSRLEFPPGQRFQEGQVDHHTFGLFEGPDDVLAQRMVDGGFPPHGTVHLGQQGGGHLNQWNAAHERGGQQTGHVTDHPTTERHHGRPAVGAQRHHPIIERAQGFQGLELLSVRHGDGLHRPGMAFQRPGDAAGIEALERVIGNGHHALGGKRLQQAWQVMVQDVMTDVDRVGGPGEIYGESLHKPWGRRGFRWAPRFRA